MTPTQAQIEVAVSRKFRTFGGGIGSEYNPIAEALKDKPLQFAAGVSVAEVVSFVLTAAAEVGYGEPQGTGFQAGEAEPAAAKVKAIDWNDIDAARAVATEATIERCAQVAKEIGHKMSNDEKAISEIVAGILALKDKP